MALNEEILKQIFDLEVDLTKDNIVERAKKIFAIIDSIKDKETLEAAGGIDLPAETPPADLQCKEAAAGGKSLRAGACLPVEARDKTLLFDAPKEISELYRRNKNS